MSNHRKKEIRAVLYSPTTAAHATGNKERQNNTKSLGKILKCALLFHMPYTCISAVFKSELYYSFGPRDIRQAGREKSVPAKPKSLHQTHPVPPDSHQLQKLLLCFHGTEIMIAYQTHIIEYRSRFKVRDTAIEIYPRFHRYNTQNIQESEINPVFLSIIVIHLCFYIHMLLYSSPRPALGLGRLQQWRKNYSDLLKEKQQNIKILCSLQNALYAEWPLYSTLLLLYMYNHYS